MSSSVTKPVWCCSICEQAARRTVMAELLTDGRSALCGVIGQANVCDACFESLAGAVTPTPCVTDKDHAIHAVLERVLTDGHVENHGHRRRGTGCDVCNDLYRLADAAGFDLDALPGSERRHDRPEPSPSSGVDWPSHFRALADRLENRTCAPSLDGYDLVDGLRAAANLMTGSDGSFVHTDDAAGQSLHAARHVMLRNYATPKGSVER